MRWMKLEPIIQSEVSQKEKHQYSVPEEEDKKQDREKILEEIIVENFPKMGKEILTQVQETQRVPAPRAHAPQPEKPLQ